MSAPEPVPTAPTRPRRGLGARLLDQWERWSTRPGGKWLFSWFVGRQVPYSGTVGPRIEQLEPGHARVSIRDRRRVRNHLRSIHAIALANLGEMATGLAMSTCLPDGWRGILVGIDIRYVKKARGVLVAEATCTLPELDGPRDVAVEGEIRDADGDVVTTVRALWRVGPPRA